MLTITLENNNDVGSDSCILGVENILTFTSPFTTVKVSRFSNFPMLENLLS
jgi:hypothetical protein